MKQKPYLDAGLPLQWMPLSGIADIDVCLLRCSRGVCDF